MRKARSKFVSGSQGDSLDSGNASTISSDDGQNDFATANDFDMVVPDAAELELNEDLARAERMRLSNRKSSQLYRKNQTADKKKLLAKVQILEQQHADDQKKISSLEKQHADDQKKISSLEEQLLQKISLIAELQIERQQPTVIILPANQLIEGNPNNIVVYSVSTVPSAQILAATEIQHVPAAGQSSQMTTDGSNGVSLVE